MEGKKHMGEGILKISEKCVQCGSCLGLDYDFICSKEDGTIVVKDVTYLGEDSNEYNELVEVCPANAFELIVDSNVNSKDAKIINKVNELRNFKGIIFPSKSDVKFNSNDYTIEIPSAHGEHRYEYSSDKAAENAAMQEFQRGMYSQIDNIILKVLTEYRVKIVKKYYSKENSVYESCNRELSEKLSSINSLLGNCFNKEFCEFNYYPESDAVWKMLSKGELISDEMISFVKSEYDYSPSNYDCKWDTDDMEVSAGTDFRGNTKYKDKYCYKNVREAYIELAKDLKASMGYAAERIEERTCELLRGLIEVYNAELQKTLDEKVKMIDAKIGNINVEKVEQKEEIDVPEKYSFYSSGIYLNGEKIENPETLKIFLTQANSFKYYYEEGDIYKDNCKSNGKKEIILKDKQFSYETLIAYNGVIVMVIKVEDGRNNLLVYDCNEDKIEIIDSYIFNIDYYNNILYYSTLEGYVRTNTKHMKSYNLKTKQRYTHFSKYGMGILRLKGIEDNKLKWYFQADNEEYGYIDL